ncbi:MAG: hypothetical protein HKN64_07010 [Woeseiaceae bacterium]|nr:hypothetical protein [Woeseiaceae bacterium]
MPDMRAKYLTLAGLLQAAAIATVLVSIVTSVDFVHRYFELFSHFRLQYLVISLLLLVAFAIRRSTYYTALLLAVTVLHSSYALPWYFGGVQAAGSPTLTIIHANVHANNDQYGRLLALVEAEDADIVFLQEVTPAWEHALQPLHDDYRYTHVQARDDYFGIAMFSRVPLDTIRQVSSPPLDYPTIVASLSVAGNALTVINTHPMIPLGRANYAARNAQLRSIADLVAQTDGAVILTGDLNTGMWGSNYRQLIRSTGLTNASRGFGILPTWPTFMPLAMIPIDHVMVSSEVGVSDIRTGPHIGSDHLPLIVTVAL